jgi:hypothetical protein
MLVAGRQQALAAIQIRRAAAVAAAQMGLVGFVNGLNRLY